MANRVTMSICGTEYILVAEEDAAYMEKIGNMVDAEMQKLMDSAHMSRDAAAVLAAACAVPAVLWGSFAPLAAAVGYGLAVWHGFRQFDGMSGDISGFGLVLGELCGTVVLAIGG